MHKGVLSVLIIAVLLIVVEWVVYASSVPVWVQPCSKDTCEVAQTSDLVPEGKIVVDNVQSIAPSNECPGVCSDLDTVKGHLHVIGTPHDIFCKIWGGPACIWKED